MKQTIVGGSLSGKVIACALVLAFVAVGLIGLVLPIIPGLLFLAIAAFVAAKHFPWLDTQLRRHQGIGAQLDKADRASHLSLNAKVQLAAWYCMKMLVGGAARIASFVAKLRAPAR